MKTKRFIVYMSRRINFYFLYVLVGVIFLLIFARYMILPGVAVVGHDSGLPLSAEMFLKTRLWAWDERVNFGQDNGYLFGSLTLHLVDYLSALVVGVSYAGNWLNFFFWFAVIFVAACLLARELGKELGFYFPILMPVVIVFNFYLFQSVFILERAKYSVLTATLLFLTIFWRFYWGRTRLIRSAILLAIVLTIFNCGGLIGVPLYGSLLVFLVAIGFFMLTWLVKGEGKARFLSTIKFLVLSLLFTVALNLYQLLPASLGLFNKAYLDELGGKAVAGSGDWLNYISTNSSFINMFRLQGIPSWYSDWYEPDVGHSYASLYLESPVLTTVSFLFPLLVVLSLVIVKRKKERVIVYFFGFAYLLAMFFMAGSHEPTGNLFKLFFDLIPGFSVFRTPYYKFASAFFISFAVLFSYILSKLVEFVVSYRLRLKKASFYGILLSIGLLGVWMAYHGVLFRRTNVFNWQPNSSTLVQVPRYVYEMSEWMEENISHNERVLLWPPRDDQTYTEGYTWGYWSLSSLPYVLADTNVLANELTLTDGEMSGVKLLYSALEEGNDLLFRSMATRLGVHYILEGNDYGKKFASLDSFGLTRVKTSGEWSLYELSREGMTKVRAATGITLVPDSDIKLLSLFLAWEKGTEVVRVDQTSENLLAEIVKRRVEVFGCQSCLMENLRTDERLPLVSIFPNSPLYFLKEKREAKDISNVVSNHERAILLLSFVQRRISETRSMISLGINESYVVKNLETSTQYLESVKQTLAESPDLLGSYVVASEVLSKLSSLNFELRSYVGSQEFAYQREDVREGIYSVLWGGREIENLFSDLTESVSELRSGKVYRLNISGVGNQRLLIHGDDLPKGETGEIVLPDKVVLENGGEKRQMQIVDGGKGWFEILGDFGPAGQAILKMDFEIINLYLEQSVEKVSFPTGVGTCRVGKIVTFEPGEAYEILVSSSDKFSALKLIVKDENQKLGGDHGYLRGRDEKMFNATGLNQPVRYIYSTREDYGQPTVYICSGGADTPEIERVEVYKIVNAPIVSRIEFSFEESPVELRGYTEVSPTERRFTVGAIQKPYLVIFNERYGPFWKLFKVGGEEVKKHIRINGFENAWYVDDSDGGEYVLRYESQRLFVVGGVLSGGAAIGMAFLLLIERWLKGRR